MDERSLRDRATPGETDRVTLLPSNLVGRLKYAARQRRKPSLYAEAVREIERLCAENEALRHDLGRSIANHVADISAHETESNPGGTGLEQSPSDSGDGRRDSGLTPGGPGGGRAPGVPISHEPHDDQRIKDWLRSLNRHLSYDGEWSPQDEEIANSILERLGSQQETEADRG